jgi:hypothetical protein
VVRCTFSPARAWRPAVVARLARTLGSAGEALQCSSRVSAIRREPNSRDAAKPRTADPSRQQTGRRSFVGHGREVEHRKRSTRQAQRDSPGSVAVHGKEDAMPLWPFVRLCLAGNNGFRSVRRVAAASFGWPICCRRWRRLEHVARHRLRRGAGSPCDTPPAITAPWPAQRQRGPSAALPNPSLKRSANGRPPGPGRRYAVHFRQPGPGGLPLSPA